VNEIQKNVEGNLITCFKVLPCDFPRRYEVSRENSPNLTSGSRLVSATSRGRSADHYNAMIRTVLREYYNNYVFLSMRARIALVILHRLRFGRGESESWDLFLLRSVQKGSGVHPTSDPMDTGSKELGTRI